MNGRWNKRLIHILLGLVALCLALPAHANSITFDHVAIHPSGTVALFYPDGWTVDESTNALQIADADALTLLLDVIDIAEVSFDELPDWLIERANLPESVSISAVTYADVDGWIVQGNGLLEVDQFTAFIILPLEAGRGLLISVIFPSVQLTSYAPLMTQIFEQMIILPATLQPERLEFSLHVPASWYFSPLGGQLLLAPRESDLQTLQQGNTPTGYGISIQVLTNADAVSIPERLQQQIRIFTINDQSATLRLQMNDLTRTGELFIWRELEDGRILMLSALAENPQTLVDKIPILKAIFASLQVE